MTRGSGGLAAALEAYVGALTISQGQGVGEPFKLLAWERDFIRGAFHPSVQVAALSVGRGNGKTCVAAALAAAALDGPLAVPRGQTIVAASSLNQSRILNDHVRAFLEATHGPLTRANGWRAVNSPNMVSITRLETGAEMRAIAADPARAHGLAPSLILADEPAQWPRSFGPRLWAALQTGLGKQPDSRAILLGTRPVTGAGHFFEALLEDGCDYVQVHAASPQSDPLDPVAWGLANPSLRAFPSLARTIAREAKRAAKSPESLASFRALRLNAGVPDVAKAELVTAAAFSACLGDAAMDAPRSWGVDLASGGAMSAVASFSLATGALDVLAAFPSVPDLAERGRKDGVGDLYQRMHERGELLVHPGHVVRVDDLLRQAARRFGAPAMVSADYHRRAELRDALDGSGIPPVKLELRRGGFGDGAEDLSRFRRAVLDRRVVARPSLLLAQAVGEARAVVNASGMSKLAKSSQGGRRHLARDDAAAAAVGAVAIGERNRSRIEASTETRFAVAR